MDLVEYKNKKYPMFQTIGHASQFAIPFAKYFCHGHGYDIGCNRVEWSYPGSIPIDPVISQQHDAYNLPDGQVDYIFSSHCLEHLPDWVAALDHWTDHIRPQGILFLYLPHYSQEYWRPWNNRKHRHVLSSEVICDYMRDRNYTNILNSERDLNDSFVVVGQKT
jgi:predicted SAM-dependent methyltransferase